MGITAIDLLAKNLDGVLVKGSGTTSGTAGTRSNHAHGLTDYAGNAKTPTLIHVVPKAADADGALTAGQGELCYVKADATNITVRAGAASVLFDFYVA